MGASFSAEFLKLRKRPATWVLALVWLALIILLGYVLTYATFASIPEDAAPPGMDPDAFLQTLYPENVLSNVLAGFSSAGGGPVALILGALAVGSEYSWGTLKTVLTQRPGRSRVLLGKVFALGLVLVGLVVLAFVAGAAASYVVSRLEGVAADWPSAGEILRALAVGLLISSVWTALGAFLAALFRGTPLAIGLGMVYALLLEGVVGTVLVSNEDYDPYRKFLVAENANSLINSFGSAAPEGLGPPDSIVEPTRAVLTLCAYAIFFVVLATLLLRRRDVT